MTSSVAIAGVLLVFSFLIIPAAIGVLYATTFSRQLCRSAGSPVPWRAPLVLLRPHCLRSADRRSDGLRLRFMHWLWRELLTHLFTVTGAARCSGALLALRWGGSLVLAASALQLMAAPRADQPLCSMWPNLRLPRSAISTFSKAEAVDFCRRPRLCGTLSHRG